MGGSKFYFRVNKDQFDFPLRKNWPERNISPVQQLCICLRWLSENGCEKRDLSQPWFSLLYTLSISSWRWVLGSNARSGISGSPAVSWFLEELFCQSAVDIPDDRLFPVWGLCHMCLSLMTHFLSGDTWRDHIIAKTQGEKKGSTTTGCSRNDGWWNSHLVYFKHKGPDLIQNKGC